MTPQKTHKHKYSTSIQSRDNPPNLLMFVVRFLERHENHSLLSNPPTTGRAFLCTLYAETPGMDFLRTQSGSQVLMKASSEVSVDRVHRNALLVVGAGQKGGQREGDGTENITTISDTFPTLSGTFYDTSDALFM